MKKKQKKSNGGNICKQSNNCHQILIQIILIGAQKYVTSKLCPPRTSERRRSKTKNTGTSKEKTHSSFNCVFMQYESVFIASIVRRWLRKSVFRAFNPRTILL